MHTAAQNLNLNSQKASRRCVKINVLFESNISIALGCSGLNSGVVIKIDVSHHYNVPQRRQEHSIHHAPKIRMCFELQLAPKP